MKIGRRQFLHGLGAGTIGAIAGLPPARAEQELPDFNEAEQERFWGAVRACYLLDPDPAYLNTGGLGPAPRQVIEAVDATARRLQVHSETGREEFEPAREAMARFIGAEVPEVCFVRNATEGNSIIASGLALSEGDEVIFETHAHPGGSFPWMNQASRRGIVVRLFEPAPSDAEASIDRIRSLIGPRTRVIQVSHVTCTNGLVFPVAEIARLARKHGVWFHVDGAQAAGMLPLDLGAIGADSYAFSGHKWLGGPVETGVLWISRDRIDEIACTSAGAHTGDYESLTGPIRAFAGAARHEYGTRNAALIAGLLEAVRWHERVGRERITARGRSLAGRILDGIAGVGGIEVLTPRDDSLRGSMVAFRHPRAGAQTLFAYLRTEHGLRCRPVTEERLEAVRVSTHIFNTPSECDRVVKAVRAAAAAL